MNSLERSFILIAQIKNFNFSEMGRVTFCLQRNVPLCQGLTSIGENHVTVGQNCIVLNYVIDNGISKHMQVDRYPLVPVKCSAG